MLFWLATRVWDLGLDGIWYGVFGITWSAALVAVVVLAHLASSELRRSNRALQDQVETRRREEEARRRLEEQLRQMDAAGITRGLLVVTTGGWESFPAVSVVDVAPPPVDGPGQAVEWLRMIDEKGSRKYRENAPSAGP